MIRVLHNQLAGRTRYKIDGLQHNIALKDHLENCLEAHQAIHDVSASATTGNVLVVYDSEKSHDAIAAAIQGALADLALDAVYEPETEKDQSGIRLPEIINTFIRKAGNRDVPDNTEKIPVPVASADEIRQKPLNNTSADWYVMDAQQAVDILNTDPDRGLLPEEISTRLARHGKNTIPEKKSRPKWYGLLDQLNAIPSYLLGGAAGLSIATGGVLDAAIIMGVLAANIAIGYFTESKAEGTIKSLQSYVNPNVWVVRANNFVEIPIENVVMGDILILKPGTYIAADARIITAAHLTVDESMLTGESVPVNKSLKALTDIKTPLSGRVNMVYKGTMVTGGQGTAVVTATGQYTEVGILQSLLDETEAPPSPIERQLDQMGNQLVVICGLVCASVFGIGFLRGYGFLVMMRMAVSLAAAAVPEGLPTAAMVNFALGLNRMKDKKVLVRHLKAVEALGAIQTICFDKTGTITENHMAVTALFVGMKPFRVEKGRILSDEGPETLEGRQELLRLLIACVLCTETKVEKNGSNGKYEFFGSATENALVELALNNGIHVERLEAQYTLQKLELRSENQLYMRAFHKTKARKKLVSVKGSPHEVLAMCRKQMKDGEVRALTDEDIRKIEIENEKMSGRYALRVLGVAFQELNNGKTPGDNLIWLGLVGMSDPIRPGVKELIEIFHQAGIDTVMITGDQSGTAGAVAKELNLAGEKPLEILDSSELPAMDPETLGAIAKRVNAYARVSPSHKLKIVQGLQNGGRIIAMTGDGINDGPALKAADIGIAMGRSGTDVAREVADVILEEDNLETLMNAVRDGRAIYSNIRKSVHFFISTNLSEILLILGAIGLGMGFPLNVMQLLWINLVSDILPGLALAMEKAEPDIMKRPPRDPNAPIFTRKDLTRMAMESGFIASSSLGAYLYGLTRYGAGARAGTMAFHSLTMGQLIYAYSCRSDHRYENKDGKLLPNPHLNKAIGGSLAMQGLIMLVPSFRRFLGITPISIMDGAVIAAGSLVPILINEMKKKKADHV